MPAPKTVPAPRTIATRKATGVAPKPTDKIVQAAKLEAAKQKKKAKDAADARKCLHLQGV